MFKKKKQDTTTEGNDATALEGDENQKSGGGDDEDKVGTLVAGDQNVHIFIETIKECNVPQDSKIDLKVETSVMGLNGYTKEYKNVNKMSVQKIEEHIFLEPRGKDIQELEKSSIQIRLMNVNPVFKNSTLGMYEFDYSNIYFNDGHTMYHQWIALTNPEAEDFGEVQAYMKVSISITATGDKQVELKPDDGADDNCKLPASIKPKYVQLVLKFYKGEQLPRLDTNLLGGKGSMDAFIKFTSGSRVIKTDIKTTKNDEAIWYQAFYIPVQMPVMNGRISLELFDFDTMSDELAASMIFDVKKLTKKDSSGNFKFQNKFFWKNLYGGHEGGGILSSGNSSQKKEMNKNPDIGSCFKGRILMSVEIKETDKVELKCIALDPKETKAADAYTQPKQYSMIGDIGSLIDPPEKNKKFSIKLCVGEHSFETDQVANQGYNFNRWNKRFHQTMDLPYVDVADIEHVFVYLMDSKKPIAYSKFDVREFNDDRPKLKWTQFKIDKAIDCIPQSNSHKTGIFSMKLTIIEGSKAITEFQTKDNPVWHKPMDKRPDIMQVRAYIFQCKDLPAADASGTSDPYIEMFDNIEMKDTNKQGKQTKYIEMSLDPMIFQCLDLQLEVNKDKNVKDSQGRPALIMPPLIMDVYDHDDGILDSTDDYMCRAVIPLEESSYKIYDDDDFDTNQPPNPKWHKLRYDSDSPVCGQILCSFVVASSDFNFKVPIKEIRLYNDVVPFEEYEVEINVLGMRNLASPGILPIKKATVEFRVQSLVPPEVSRQIPNICTEPGPSGPDPTINTNIVFNVPLPCEEKYEPALACRVYDHIFLGGSKQLCGTFTIPLGKLMHEKRAENLFELATVDAKIKELADILEGVAPMCYDSSRQKSAIAEDQGFTEMAQTQKKETFKEFDKISQAFSFHRDKVEQQAVKNKVQGMKRPLLLCQDETDDSEEDPRNTYQPPTAINSSYKDQTSSVPVNKTPSINTNLVNKQANQTKSDSGSSRSIGSQRSSQSARMRRQAMTQEEKNQADKEVIDEVLNTPTKQSRTVSKNAHPDTYKPVGTPRRSLQEFDEKLSESKGDYNNSASKMGTGLRLALTQQLSQQIQNDVETQNRQQESERQKVQHEFESGSNNAFKNCIIPEYELDKRLNRQKGNQPIKDPIYREKNVPPKEVFMGLGWDPKPTVEQVRHYRRFYEDALENSKDIMEKPTMFDSYDIKKGAARGNSGGLLAGLGSLFKKKKVDTSGQEDTVQTVGKFKGVVIVETKERKLELVAQRNQKLEEAFQLLEKICKKTTGKDFGITMDDLEKNPDIRDEFKNRMQKMGLAHLRLLKTFYDLRSEEIMANQMLIEKKCSIRTYVISAFDLARKDTFSESDPYFVLKLGKQVFNDRENYQEDEPAPDFFNIIDFEGKFPGCPLLEIQVYDWDLIFGDDLIGVSFVDLEDRFFSPEWQSVPHKPIEYRQLFHPSTTLPQGTVKMFVEVIPKEKLGVVKKWNIEKKPFEEFEVRVVIWDTTELESMDSEGTTDGFVKGFIDADDVIRETDTHFRNMDGKCSWNWRMVFKIQHPRSNYKLTIQTYDRDFFSANELIGQDTIDLFPLIDDAALSKRPVSLTEDYVNEYPKPEAEFNKEANRDVAPDGYCSNLKFDPDEKTQFWMNVLSINDKGKTISRGNLKVSVDVYPSKDAENNPVGKGRDDPNLNPFLPPPTGRLELSLNPCKMLDQMIDADTKRKILCYCCCLAFCALIIMMIPMIFSNMMSEIFMAPFK